ncbi:MAG: rRNA maturation RNAse YbeY [Patescibacteria group bacterium]
MTAPQINLKNLSDNSVKIARKAVFSFFNNQYDNFQPVVNITAADSKKMRALNKKYRNKEYLPQVLSFPIWKNLKDIPKIKNKKNPPKILLGDIFILKNALYNPVLFQKLIDHSLSHLIGKHH